MSTRPLVSLAFGVPYVSVALTDTVDGEFGPLPLPDLQGRWLFDLPQGAQVVALAASRVEAGRVVFSSATLELVCASATQSQRAGCALQGASAGSPVFARLGDVSETRMLFRSSATGVQSFYAERLPAR